MSSVPESAAGAEPAIPESPDARLRLFGFGPTDVRVGLVRRSRSWRTTRALFVGFVALGLAPLAALVPPHVPWALLVLGGGAVLAGRRLRERSTLRRLEGSCPACGTPQALAAATRLRDPHRFPCTGCHRELTLDVQRDRPADGAPRDRDRLTEARPSGRRSGPDASP